MRQSLVTVSLLVLMLSACGSTPQTDFYLLTADAKPSGTAAATVIRVGVAELGVAEYLRRAELLSLEGGNKLYVDPYRRWAEPLDDGVRRTLVLNLGALLDSDAVRAMPWPRDWIPHWLLRCYIARLDVQDDHVELVAIWSVQDGRRERAAIEHTSRLSRARNSDSPERIAADVSALLLELSEQIASSMRGGDEVDDASTQTQ